MNWYELTNRKEEFQSIVSLLVDFDEKTGRYLRYTDASTHWMRRCISKSDPEKTRILIRHLGQFVYAITIEHKNETGLVVTSYIHEDGIRIERNSREKSHPVHTIVSVSDLFEKDCTLFTDESSLNAFTCAIIKERT